MSASPGRGARSRTDADELDGSPGAGPRITVVTAAIDALTSALPGAIAALIDDAERVRAASLRSPAAERAFVAGRALARVALARALGGRPSEWRLDAVERTRRPGAWRSTVPDAAAEDPAARGAIAHGRVACPASCLSLSRAGTVVGAAVAVDAGTRLGFDLESRLGADGVDEISPVLAPGEARSIGRLPWDARRAAALAFWTLKEALAKALDAGVTIGLERLAFELRDDGDRVAQAPGVDPRRWRFVRRVLDDGTVAALALECDADPRVEWISLDAAGFAAHCKR